MKIHLPDEAATQALGVQLALEAQPGDMIFLKGPIGAGKSTLARSFIQTLMQDPHCVVPSPTFTLVQAYDTPSGITLWHFDLYRLNHSEEFFELGFDVARQGVMLVEWPERIADLGLAPSCAITLSIEGEARQAEVLS
jgi:tRNA threonylcarbamoyladenosine biosynthesis protein TsaE